LVRWFVESGEDSGNKVIFRGEQGSTNLEGLTRVMVSSDTGGKFKLSVLCERSGTKAHFDEITFEGGGPPA
jgi:hypothetical protein